MKAEVVKVEAPKPKLHPRVQVIRPDKVVEQLPVKR